MTLAGFSMGRKGQGMALETVFKVLIMLVTVAVIIALIVRFSDQIKNQVTEFINKLTGKGTGTSQFPKTIEKSSFTSGEIASYIESCYASITALPETEQKDTNCFILIGNSFESAGILDKVSPTVKSHVTITSGFNRGVVIVDFVDVGNKIIVR